jgi:hypothetical protein
MKSIKISGMSHPIVLIDSVEALDRNSADVQCVLYKETGNICAYFYHGADYYSAWGKTSMQAAEQILGKIRRYQEDCKTVSVTIDDEEYPVKSRSVLWDRETQSERDAPIGVVHWWLKGADGEEYYKCDIHFPEGGTFEGIGKTLDEALADLVVWSNP